MGGWEQNFRGHPVSYGKTMACHKDMRKSPFLWVRQISKHRWTDILSLQLSRLHPLFQWICVRTGFWSLSYCNSLEKSAIFTLKICVLGRLFMGNEILPPLRNAILLLINIPGLGSILHGRQFGQPSPESWLIQFSGARYLPGKS